MGTVPAWFRLLYDSLEKGDMTLEKEAEIITMIRSYFDSDEEHAKNLYSHAVSVITYPLPVSGHSPPHNSARNPARMP